MEHLVGETLAARLSRGPLPPDQVMRYATEIANALAAAHLIGIVHRDLKPANIMLTQSGSKLQDFGLAKFRKPAEHSLKDVSVLETVTVPEAGAGDPNSTRKGVLVGTFQYMAPEQLEGKEADVRSDLFAFGAVVHEMATGRKAFQGSSLIGAILHSEPPPVSSLRGGTTPALDYVVKTCLSKNPDDRWQSAHVLQLQWIAGSSGAANPIAPRHSPAAVLGWLVAGILLLAVAFLIPSRRGAPTYPARFLVTPPEGTALLGSIAVSPDGAQVAFVAARPLGQVGPVGAYRDPALSPDERKVAVARVDPATGTHDIWLLEPTREVMSRLTFQPGDEISPVWSPDGSRIVFASDRDGPANLYQKAASGAETEQPLLKTLASKFPTDWSRGAHSVVFAMWDPKTHWDLWTLPMMGDNKPAPYFRAEFDSFQAQFSPDGRWIAYASNESNRYEVYVQPFPLSSGRWQISTHGGTQPQWRRDGTELYYLAPDRKLMAVGVKSGATLEPGPPKPLFQTQVTGLVDVRNHYVPGAGGQRFLVNSIVGEGASTPIAVALNWLAGLKQDAMLVSRPSETELAELPRSDGTENLESGLLGRRARALSEYHPRLRRLKWLDAP